jgi:hypothetical protein
MQAPCNRRPTRAVAEEQNAVRRAYTHGAEYWFERVAMMQTWADYLDKLKLTGKVIPLRRENF